MFTGEVIGFLGADAKETVKEGKVSISFSLSSNNYAKVPEQKKTTWIQCFLNRASPVVDYLKKGTQVYVSGDLYVDIYNKGDGTAVPSVVLSVSKLELLSNKKEEGKKEEKEKEEKK